MDRVTEILQERVSRLRVTAGCLDDLLAVLEKYEYRARPADVRALKYCTSDRKRLPKTELTVGAVSGFLLGCIVKQRMAATFLGMYFGYMARNPVPAADRCLDRILCLPTPMGAEMEAILRRRDANHHLLKQLPDRSGLQQGRIDTPEYEKQKLSTTIEGDSSHAGDELWKLSDPFGICFQQDANVSGPGTAKDAAKSIKAQQRNQQRQDVHKA